MKESFAKSDVLGLGATMSSCEKGGVCVCIYIYIYVCVKFLLWVFLSVSLVLSASCIKEVCK